MFNLSKRNKSEAFEKIRAKWLNTRLRGKQRFIFTRGVLGWGGFMFIFMTVVHNYIDHENTDWSYILIAVLVWAVGGYSFGVWQWNWQEKKLGPGSKNPYSK